MRLGRKLSEGFAVDHDAEVSTVSVPPVAERTPERARPVSAEADHPVGNAPGTAAEPVGSGQPPIG